MIRTQTKQIVVKQTESGHRYDGISASTPYGPIERTWTLPSVSIVTDSQSSAGVIKKVKVMVPYRPRNPRPVTEPVMPHLRLPLRPVLSPKRPNQSQRSYDRQRHRYAAKLQRYDRIVDEKRNRYYRQWDKYRQRVSAYVNYVHRMKYGVEKERRVITVNSKDLPWHPYSRRIQVDLPLRGTYKMSRNTYFTSAPWHLAEDTTITGYAENYWRGPPNLSHAKITSMLAKALSAADSKATRKIHDEIGEQSVHIGNILAERQQTFDMIAGLVRDMFRIVRSFSWKYAISESFEVLNFFKNKILANRLLEFFFGVKPLMQDIHDAVEALKKKEADTFFEFKARATSRDSAEITNPYHSSGQTEIWDCDTMQVRVSAKVSYVLQYEVANGYSSALQQFGLINPAEILWEKIPWSFVIDWLLPIGGWIRSFSSEVGLTFVRGSKVTTTQVMVLIKRDFKSEWYHLSDSAIAEGSWSGLHHVIEKKRELLTSAPKYDFPTFKNPISWTHIIEALALFRQQIR